MKKAIKLIVFTIVAVLVISETYRILSWKDTTGGYLSATQQLYATEDDLIDLLFLGSSHCYCGINPSVLWDEYGISAFDMAVSGQDKDSTYHMLKEVLKTQSPKVVCIDMWGLFYDEHEVLGNLYRNMLCMKTSKNSVDLVQSHVEKEEQGDFILRWPIIHTRYRELGMYDFVQYEPSIYGRGYEVNYEISENFYPAEAIACKDVLPLSETNREWLDNLIALSEEEGFELIMFFAPTYLSAGEQPILNGAKEYLQEQGIQVLDFNQLGIAVGYDYKTDFSDGSHLNIYGAEKTTAYMGEYLTERYEFEDHRGDERYHLWDECSVYMNHIDFRRKISPSMEYEAYLNKIDQYDNLITVICLDGNYMDSEMNYEPFVEIMGISEEEYYMGGIWVFEDGECIFYMNEQYGEIYRKDLSDTDTLKLQNVPGQPALMEVNGISCRNTYDGMSVMVYDKILHMIISEKAY